MSCNGCRVLRKGCSESCILRPCLQWIESPESQGHATVFVAKFFGRAGLMSFISAVPESQRPGLLWTGNWHVCQAAVETVLRGGTLRPVPELLNSCGGSPTPTSDEVSEAEVTCTDMSRLQDRSFPSSHCRFSSSRSKVSPAKRKRVEESAMKLQQSDLDLRLTPRFTGKVPPEVRRRPGTPSMNSEESGTTTCFESGLTDHRYLNGAEERKLLNLFV
ncbi:LOB domain-containing protein 38 [Citrus sinensis]|uniref:LOB domain-containing protein 38 n=1 Tax=Citrus sinensis TaxID=2711 RepID=A0ACB8J5S2_CITSI|nr:LOB domain-containing protein 38 [Citrus sinensis]